MVTPSIFVPLVLAIGSWGSRPGQPGDPPVQSPVTSPAQTPAPGATPTAEFARDTSGLLTSEERESVLADIERSLRRRAFVLGVDFQAWPERLAEVRESVDKAERPRDLANAVNRALSKFGISHLRLNAPAPNAPAPNAAPNRPTPAGEPEPGARQPGGPPRTAENQTLSWLDGDIAVLRLRSFDDDRYDRGKIEAFLDEIAPRAKGIILDLRGNGGGAVTAMSHLLGLFLPAGTEIGVYVNRGIVRSFERAMGQKATNAEAVAAWTNQKYRVTHNHKPPVTAPVAVLISRNSASASEIVAAALRDHAHAALVGQPSAGKVLLSTHAKLKLGFELQIPTADYVTSRGLRLEGNALRPTFTASGGRGGSEQAVRLAADLLRNGL